LMKFLVATIIRDNDVTQDCRDVPRLNGLNAETVAAPLFHQSPLTKQGNRLANGSSVDPEQSSKCPLGRQIIACHELTVKYLALNDASDFMVEFATIQH